jgi:hypothetical protein
MSLKGTAGYVTNLGKYLKGTIHGVIQNNNCNFVILWESGDRSSYEGKIASDGRAEGLQYSVKNPSAKFHWYFTSPLQCAGATAAVTPRPIKTIGKGVGPSTAAVPPPVTQTNVPGIAANPTTVSIPAGQSEGTATLTWDAGPAHPYAEVWVQVDGGDAQFVVERAKGTRSVTVQRGQTVSLYAERLRGAVSLRNYPNEVVVPKADSPRYGGESGSNGGVLKALRFQNDENLRRVRAAAGAATPAADQAA